MSAGRFAGFGIGLWRAVRPYSIQLVLLIGIWAYFVSTSSTFRGSSAIYPVLEGFGLLGIATLGIAVTMVAGELDLSVGSMAAVAGIVAVNLAGLGLVPCLLLATLIGVLVGLVQGGVIGRLAINSLVLTIGTLILLRGVAYILSGEDPVPLENLAVSDPLLERYGVFSASSILALVLFVLFGAFLGFTARGREIYATGGGRQEAIAAGVSTRRAIMIAFAIAAGLAALAGAMASIKGGSAAPQAFPNLALSAIAAALIGGISLYGGRGSVINIALGVAIVSLISAGLTDRGAQGYVTELVTGGLLVAVIATDYAIRVFKRLRLRSEVRHAVLAEGP